MLSYVVDDGITRHMYFPRELVSERTTQLFTNIESTCTKNSKKSGTYFRNAIDLVFHMAIFQVMGDDLFQNSLILIKTLVSKFIQQIRQCTLESYIVLKNRS